MLEWQLWFILSFMLLIGAILNVGIFLFWFSLAAAVTGIVGVGNFLDLPAQLHLFIAISLSGILFTKIKLKKRQAYANVNRRN